MPFAADSCGIDLAPDERRLYVANRDNNLVTVLDTDLRILHHIPVPPGPFGVVVACPDGCPTLPPTATPTATPVPPPCVGDCGGDGKVTVGDLVTAVSVAIGSLPIAACASADTNGDGTVEINELVRAVESALAVCQAAP